MQAARFFNESERRLILFTHKCKSGPAACVETCADAPGPLSLAKSAARFANASGFAPESAVWSECIRQLTETRMRQVQLESFIFDARRFEVALNESKLEYSLSAPLTPPLDKPLFVVEGQDVVSGGGGVIESLFSHWHLRHMDRWELSYVPSTSQPLGVCHQTLENLPGSILDSFNYTAAYDAGGMLNPHHRSSLYHSSGQCCSKRGFPVPFYLQFAQPSMLHALQQLHADRAQKRLRFNLSDLRFSSSACVATSVQHL